MPAEYTIQDTIGPIMVGPSSSHTAGALAISAMTRNLLGGEPASVIFKLYGSFAHTYRGHGTDRALVAGLLGMATDDARVRDSLEIADQLGVHVAFDPCPDDPCGHPNTVDIEVTSRDGVQLSVRGESIGGGAARLVRIDGMKVEITGKSHSLVVRQRDVKGVLASIASALADCDVNIATANMYRTARGAEAFTIVEVDDAVPTSVVEALVAQPNIIEVRSLPVMSAGAAGAATLSAQEQDDALRELHRFNFTNGTQLLERCAALELPISELFLRRNALVFASEGFADGSKEYLQHVLEVMRASARGPLEHPIPSIGGLIGGEAAKVKALNESTAGMGLGNRAEGETPKTSMVAKMIQYALAVLETNASMGCIVAAPTAGSAGVIPAVLLAFQEEHQLSDEAIVGALANASAIGYLISRNATVSGAEGGCQAEIGSASAMAASAMVELCGGTPAQCLAAASNALANLLGLVCDPIAGLVEAPCQKRNATAALNALASAEIALAGVENLVDFDQTVEAMHQVGGSMSYELRETALGGMAATPAACDFCERCRVK